MGRPPYESAEVLHISNTNYRIVQGAFLQHYSFASRLQDIADKNAISAIDALGLGLRAAHVKQMAQNGDQLAERVSPAPNGHVDLDSLLLTSPEAIETEIRRLEDALGTKRKIVVKVFRERPLLMKVLKRPVEPRTIAVIRAH